MMQGGPKVAPAAGAPPGKPQTFQPTKLIIRIMLGPGRACDVAKKFANSWFVIQPWASTTSWRTSGRTVGKPPKLIEERSVRLATKIRRAVGLLIAPSPFERPPPRRR